MYRLGRRSKKKAKKQLWFVILALLLIPVIAIGYFIVRVAKDSDVKASTPQAITREYAVEEVDDRKVFDQTEFVVKLPNDWALKDHVTEPYNLYSWQATKKNADNRWLEIYVDRYPKDKAFNRLLPVSIDNNKIIVTGSVSENCTAFTGPQGANQAPASGVETLPAKWQGVDFLCDMANYTRNSVGVGTTGSQTAIKLSGAKTGMHTFFFVYIDHNINPDYQLLENTLASLEVK
jgi:hypothetical protein